ncbi:sensor domain-containing protein [Mycolicibacterium llatzerense]|uniref:sensor domain-containing protein n=1 Tax=Mycolicibacterium llatzerense TaxID=280871 RepID=UPI0021B5A732|nr:sensor domain-containing protein [Mycolicibacterium llatzerense]
MTNPGPQQDPQYPPPWTPTQGPAYPYPPVPPRSSRSAVIIAAGIVGTALIVAGIILANHGMGGPQHDGAAAGSSTSATPTLVQAVPATLLPTPERVRQATLIDAKYTPNVITKVGTDLATTPAQCALADAANTQSSWGTAISVAVQRFGDGPDYDHSINFGGVAAAIFDTTEAAADSLATVTNSVRSCTSFTTPDADHLDSTLAWAVTDIAAHDNQLVWTDSQTAVSTQWKCAKSYRVQDNLVAYAYVCGSNPSDGPAKLTDQIIAKATNK